MEPQKDQTGEWQSVERASWNIKIKLNFSLVLAMYACAVHARELWMCTDACMHSGSDCASFMPALSLPTHTWASVYHRLTILNTITYLLI